MLHRAIAHRATDVHLDPFGDETEVRFRIDGRLEHYCRLSESIGEQLMAQLKVLANLDPSEPFHPHEGRLSDGLQKVCDGITTLEEIAAVSCL